MQKITRVEFTNLDKILYPKSRITKAKVIEFYVKIAPKMLNFLAGLPKGYRFTVEVRNRDLLDDKLYALLSEKGVALTIADSPFMPVAENMTADFVYVRWEGDRKKVKGTRTSRG